MITFMSKRREITQDRLETIRNWLESSWSEAEELRIIYDHAIYPGLCSPLSHIHPSFFRNVAFNVVDQFLLIFRYARWPFYSLFLSNFCHSRRKSPSIIVHNPWAGIEHHQHIIDIASWMNANTMEITSNWLMFAWMAWWLGWDCQFVVQLLGARQHGIAIWILFFSIHFWRIYNFFVIVATIDLNSINERVVGPDLNTLVLKYSVSWIARGWRIFCPFDKWIMEFQAVRFWCFQKIDFLVTNDRFWDNDIKGCQNSKILHQIHCSFECLPIDECKSSAFKSWLLNVSTQKSSRFTKYLVAFESRAISHIDTSWERNESTFRSSS